MNIKIILLLIFTVTANFSQTEIVINSITDNAQREPIIEKYATEDIMTDALVAVWKSENQVDPFSEGDIYLRLLNSDLQLSENEILVNELTSGNQQNPQVASDKLGHFIVVWSSFNPAEPEKFYDIKAKLYFDNAELSGEITVNTNTENSQVRPQIDIINKGNNLEFIVVWDSWFQDGSERGVYAQRFNHLMEKIGDEFLVNTTTEFSQCRPVVKYFNDGRFIIVWESWNESEKGYNIFGKIYDADGNVIKDEFMVNSYTNNYQWFGDISIVSDNTFDIVWCSWEQDGYDGGIYLRSFNESYNPVGDEILVNSSTEFYQWLPKIKRFEDDRKVIIWSSWNIDGSREGVYYKIMDKQNRVISLEQRINSYTDSYQWEPSIVTTKNNEFIAAWSSWGEYGTDYEIMANKVTPSFLVGIIDSSTLKHSSGTSTSNFIVHVVDSTKLTGHNYEISFTEFNEEFLQFSINDLTLNEAKVENYPLTMGTNVQYLTDEFDGIMVEILPNFDLDIDFERSYFTNNSGTNITFDLENPIIYPDIAPIDVAVIFGNSDTLATGNFVEPLDMAINPSNVPEIEIPFIAKIIATGEKLKTLVFENSNTKNKRWDPGEKIVFLTPDEYKSNDFSTHLQIISAIPEGETMWPNVGDTIFVFTNIPLSTDDIYQFTTKKEDLILGLNDKMIKNSYILFQNYPNPFNPTTTIKYTIPTPPASSPLANGRTEVGFVSLVVYDILGREVTTLVNEVQKPGSYSILFDASNLSSGIYFYRLQTPTNQIVKKMLLLQ